MNGAHDDEILSELVDGRLDDLRVAEVEQHLASCDACRTLVADLRRLKADAARLPIQRPPARVWARIAAQLPDADRPAWRRMLAGAFGTRLAWAGGLALAATTVVLIVVIGPAWRPRHAPQAAAASRERAVTATPVHATGTELVQSVESELRMAEQHYEKAIEGLQQAANTDQAALDPRVAATLRRNLAVIDQAVQECRQALQAQPTNQLARDGLFDALRQKVGLLQNTVALIAEMRKGNPDQAAKILGNLNKT
jgi:anti-sigma factor RsiW